MTLSKPAAAPQTASSRGPAPALYPWPAGKTSAAWISIDVDADTPLLWRLREASDDAYLSEREQRQYGLRAGLRHLLQILARHEVQATFFVPGLIAARQPALLPDLVAAGHEVGLHGFAHEATREISTDAFGEALEASIATFVAQTGQRPAGFRAPGWELTRPMHALLRAQGLYDSSLAGLDHPYTLDDVLELPVSWNREDTARFKMTGLDARWPPTSPVVVLQEWLFDWEACAAAGGLFTLTLHDWVSGRPGPARVLDQLLARIRQDETAWLTTGAGLAAHDRQLAPDLRTAFASAGP
jgi:peptidoglycan/xylan/chitin deacetylase (PgdA/CDA1 family)